MDIYRFAAQGGERFISGLMTGVFYTPAPQRYYLIFIDFSFRFIALG
jgi:hypothetical protein